MEITPGLHDAASAVMLEPLAITIKFTDDELYSPDVQVDVWTNLAHALSPQADATLTLLESAAFHGASIALATSSDSCDSFDPLLPIVRVEGSSNDEWHAIRTAFDAKRNVFVATCFPTRPGSFEYTARAIYPPHSGRTEMLWAGNFRSNAVVHVMPPRLHSSLLSSPLSCGTLPPPAIASLLTGSSCTATQLHNAWCGARFAHWFHYVKVTLCDSQRLPANPLSLFAQVLLASDLEAQVTAPRATVRRILEFALRLDWFKSRTNVAKLFKRSATLTPLPSAPAYLPTCSRSGAGTLALQQQRVVEVLALAPALPCEVFCAPVSHRHKSTPLSVTSTSASEPQFLMTSPRSASSGESPSCASPPHVVTSLAPYRAGTPIILPSRSRHTQAKYLAANTKASPALSQAASNAQHPAHDVSSDGYNHTAPQDCDSDVMTLLLRLAMHAPPHTASDYNNGEGSGCVLQILVQLVKLCTVNMLSPSFIQALVHQLMCLTLKRHDKPYIVQLLQLCCFAGGSGGWPHIGGRGSVVRRRVEVTLCGAILSHMDTIHNTLLAHVPRELDLPDWITGQDDSTSPLEVNVHRTSFDDGVRPMSTPLLTPSHVSSSDAAASHAQAAVRLHELFQFCSQTVIASRSSQHNGTSINTINGYPCRVDGSSHDVAFVEESSRHCDKENALSPTSPSPCAMSSTRHRTSTSPLLQASPSPSSSVPALFGSNGYMSSTSDTSDTDMSTVSTRAVAGRPPKPPQPSSNSYGRSPLPSTGSQSSLQGTSDRASSAVSQHWSVGGVSSAATLAHNVSPLVKLLAYAVARLSPITFTEYESLLRCTAAMAAADLMVARVIMDTLLRAWPKGDTAKEVRLLKFLGEHSKWAALDAEKEALSAPSGRSTPGSRCSISRFSESGSVCGGSGGGWRSPASVRSRASSNASDSDDLPSSSGHSNTATRLASSPLALSRTLSNGKSSAFGKPSVSTASSVFEFDSLSESDRDCESELAVLRDECSPLHAFAASLSAGSLTDLSPNNMRLPFASPPPPPAPSDAQDENCGGLVRNKSFANAFTLTSSTTTAAKRAQSPADTRRSAYMSSSPSALDLLLAVKPVTLLDRLIRRLCACITSEHCAVARQAIELFDVTAASAHASSACAVEPTPTPTPRSLSPAPHSRFGAVSSASARHHRGVTPSAVIKGCLERVLIMSPHHRDKVVAALGKTADYHWSASIRCLSNLVCNTIIVRAQCIIGAGATHTSQHDASTDDAVLSQSQPHRSRSPLCRLSTPPPTRRTLTTLPSSHAQPSH